MVLSLETLDASLTLCGEGVVPGCQVIGYLVELGAVTLVEVLKSMKILLVFASLELLQSLDLCLQLLSLGYELLLVLSVGVSILVDRNGGLSNVNLNLMTLVLGVTKKRLVESHILFQIIDDLESIKLGIHTATCSLRATMVVLRCSFSTSRSVKPLTSSRSRPEYSSWWVAEWLARVAAFLRGEPGRPLVFEAI